MGTFKQSVVLAVGFIGMLAGSARAEETLVAKIPFAFVVRGVELPAGRYDIVDNQGVITIRGDGVQRGSGAVTMATPASGKDPDGRDPALVFIHSEGRYTLSQIWESDSKGLAVVGRSTKGHDEAALTPASAPLTVVAAEYGK
jgi:hypothetical protein